VLGLNGFEVQRKIGILKSATIAKESFEVWWFLDMVRLSDGWDEFIEEHKLMDIESVFHWDIGGRFWIHEKTSRDLQ
jgi:hypothetical protein